MSYGIELYNNNGRVVTVGENEEYMYWGSVTHSMVGGTYTSATKYSIFNIPSTVHVQIFHAWNSFPSSKSSSYCLINTYKSDGTVKVRLFNNASGTRSVTFYVFVPCSYIADLASMGVRVWNANGVKIWSTDRPMLKFAGYRKQLASSCNLVAGSTPSRPAMSGGFGSPSGDYTYSHSFNGSSLVAEWSGALPSFLADANVAIHKPMIDRDYYDQFSNLGNF